jgi:LuxR family maltose regulon positive regulatory protein
MDSTLLSTKTRVPPQTHPIVRRSRLLAVLEREIPDYKLILVAAPAGYGKTTLLAHWARSGSFPVAWLSLDEADNDPDRFLRYLLLAWDTVQPGIRDSPLGLLLGAKQPERAAVLAAFVNATNELPEHLAVVLDDYHLIGEAAVHEVLASLLDHLPPTLHIVLTGRGDPPLPLARYRARQELLEIRTEELNFTQDETAEFLNDLKGFNLAREEIARLHSRLEGWIAGLHLVSLSLRRQAEPAEWLAVAGRHRFVADYLSQDVLAQLPDDTRRFLLQTSILDRLRGGLCDAVTGREGGQETLELLERQNLFLVPLDDRREWFRYHRLFADFLRDELHRCDGADVGDLHRRAGRWYFVHDLPEPAFRHALQGDDRDLATAVVQRYASAKVMGGEYRILKEWVESIPPEWTDAYPVLALPRAALMTFAGQIDACVRHLDDIERKLIPLEDESNRVPLALVTTVRCFIACIRNNLPEAEAMASRALADLPEVDLGHRPGIFVALGDTYRVNGRWEDARACYLRALTFDRAPALRVRSDHVFGALADLDLRQGHLKQAADHWRRALAATEEPANWGRLDLPETGWAHLRLGELLYEWNDLAGARDHLARGFARTELGGDVRAQIAGGVLVARLKLTDGDVEAAAALLERTRPLAEQSPFPDWTSRFERCQLELWLAQRRLKAAVDWTEARLRDGVLESRPDSESVRLATARVMIVTGNPSARDRALRRLDLLRRSAEAEGRTAVAIEALALQAIAHWQGGDRTRALTALDRALRLAEPEEYVRLFADLGLSMARLLQEAQSRDVMPDYVATLLAACGTALTDRDAASGALPEPLSPREREVLSLLAAGLTNREIAATLSISPETVKKHTAAIYGKLGASNRTEAAAMARELDVLA